MEVTDNLLPDPSGRIMVLWNPLVVKLAKITEPSQFIHFDASYTVTRARFDFTVVYGANDISTRRTLWSDLANMQSP